MKAIKIYTFLNELIKHKKLWNGNWWIELLDNDIISNKDIFWPDIVEKEWSNKPPFKDKELIWGWNNNSINRELGYWDSVNECLFAYNGKRFGSSYENYDFYSGELLAWMQENYKKLED